MKNIILPKIHNFTEVKVLKQDYTKYLPKAGNIVGGALHHKLNTQSSAPEDG